MEGTRRRPVWAVCAAVVVAAAVRVAALDGHCIDADRASGMALLPREAAEGRDEVRAGRPRPQRNHSRARPTQALKPVLYCDPVNSCRRQRNGAPGAGLLQHQGRFGNAQVPGSNGGRRRSRMSRSTGRWRSRSRRPVCVFTAFHQPVADSPRHDALAAVARPVVDLVEAPPAASPRNMRRTRVERSAAGVPTTARAPSRSRRTPIEVPAPAGWIVCTCPSAASRITAGAASRDGPPSAGASTNRPAAGSFAG